jgi:formate hydrogenlyase regulatory protein HycA
MTIWEISEKADYIAERHRRLQDQWRIYCNSLVQGITLSKARLHHAMSCAPDKDLCFVLFEHFTIYVTLADGFNSHTIEYYVETKDGDDKQLIAQAQLTIDGKSMSVSVTAIANRCWSTISRKSPPSTTACTPRLRTICR